MKGYVKGFFNVNIFLNVLSKLFIIIGFKLHIANKLYLLRRNGKWMFIIIKESIEKAT